jgi:fatty-acyl-CoA synthase
MGRSTSEVAKQLGIPDWSIRDWVRAAKRQEDQNLDKSTKSHAQENAELKKKLKQLEMENEILKKATAYFAKSLP